MIADASQMSYIHDFMPFSLQTEGFLEGWYLSDSQNQKTCCFYTANKLLYTEKILHTEAFTQRGIYTEQLLHRRFCTQTLLHTEAFAQKGLF